MPFDEPNDYRPAYEAFWENSIAAGTPSPTRAGLGLSPPLPHAGRPMGAAHRGGPRRDYCGSRLAGNAPGGLYRLRFPEPGEGNGTGSVQPSCAAPLGDPLARHRRRHVAGRVVESTLVESLSPPSAVADTSWIKPGRVSWSWLFDPPSPQDFPKL